jgi:predicted nucleic acid-binding protein
LNVYLDSSFLVSTYSLDANSEQAIRQLGDALDYVLLLTPFAELELVNALELRVFRKSMSASQARVCLGNFARDVEAGILLRRDFAESVFPRARQISLETTARLGVRAGDILHVAAALEFGADAFYSFDTKQRSLAFALNLTLNPTQV